MLSCVLANRRQGALSTVGLFNSIIADLPCETKAIVARGEIQIKWQTPEKRASDVYYPGEALVGLMQAYDNVWIKTDFVCEACSPRTKARDGTSFIKVMDQQRHVIFVHIEDGRIVEIISKKEFVDRNVENFPSDLA